jgi:hypothetical protein
MQTISIHIGLTDAAGNVLPAQLLYTDGLTSEDVLVALRQAEGQIIAVALAQAEQRGREQAGTLEEENRG